MFQFFKLVLSYPVLQKTIAFTSTSPEIKNCKNEDFLS